MTNAERMILKSIPKKYDYIGREKKAELGQYNLYVTNIPFDYEFEYASLEIFNDLFRFIKPRRRIYY